MENFNSLIDKLKKNINFSLFDKAVLSNPIKKGEGLCFKAVVTKILLQKEESFQISYYIDKKVVHENLKPSSELPEEFNSRVIKKIITVMSENFKQCNISANKNITVLMNKKKEFKIASITENASAEKKSVSHNVSKNYIIQNGVFANWLFEIGMIDKNGNVLSHMQKKFRQINRFLEMVADIEKYIPNNGLIVDMGCGKSYLTFAMYHYFNILKNKNVKIKGFDLKKDVVENCNTLAKKSNFSNLEFFADDIANLDTSKEKVDMIITLHACDTATDFALAHAVKWNCKVIMSVPCCQHELFYQVENKNLKNLLSYGILKERFSALLTDSIRAQTLELCGYKTSVLEFIDMEHTPKNIMIRAVKKEKFCPSEEKKSEYKNVLENFNVKPTISTLLKDFI